MIPRHLRLVVYLLALAAVPRSALGQFQLPPMLLELNKTCAPGVTLEEVMVSCGEARNELDRADCAGSTLQYLMLSPIQMPLIACLAVELVRNTTSAPPTALMQSDASTTSRRAATSAHAHANRNAFSSQGLRDTERSLLARSADRRPRKDKRAHLKLTQGDPEPFVLHDCYRSVYRAVDRLWILHDGDHVARQSYEHALNLTSMVASKYCTDVCNRACYDAAAEKFVAAVKHRCDVTPSTAQPPHCESEAALIGAVHALCAEPAYATTTDGGLERTDSCPTALGRAFMHAWHVPDAARMCIGLGGMGTQPVEDTLRCAHGVFLEYFYRLATSLTPVDEWAPAACDNLMMLAGINGTDQEPPNLVVCAGALGTSLMAYSGNDMDVSNGFCDSLSDASELVDACKQAVSDRVAQHAVRLQSDTEACVGVGPEYIPCFSADPRTDCPVCFEESDSARCDNLGMEQCVCEYDEVCCNQVWDRNCVHLVSQFECPCVAGSLEGTAWPTPTLAPTLAPAPLPTNAPTAPTPLQTSTPTSAPTPVTTAAPALFASATLPETVKPTSAPKPSNAGASVAVGVVFFLVGGVCLVFCVRRKRAGIRGDPAAVPTGAEVGVASPGQPPRGSAGSSPAGAGAGTGGSFLSFIFPFLARRQGFRQVLESHEAHNPQRGPLDDHDEQLPAIDDDDDDDDVRTVQLGGVGSSAHAPLEGEESDDEIAGFNAAALEARKEKKSALQRAKDALTGGGRKASGEDEAAEGQALTSNVGGGESQDFSRIPVEAGADLESGGDADAEVRIRVEGSEMPEDSDRESDSESVA